MKLINNFIFNNIIQKDFVDNIIGKVFNPITYEQAILKITTLSKNKYDIVVRQPLKKVQTEVITSSFYKNLWQTVALYNYLAYKYLTEVDAVINRYLRFKITTLKSLKTETDLIELQVNNLRKSLSNKIVNARLVHIPLQQNGLFSTRFSVEENKAYCDTDKIIYDSEKYIQKIVVDRFQTKDIELIKYGKNPEEDYSVFGNYSILKSGNNYGTWYEEAITGAPISSGYIYTVTIYFNNSLPVNYIKAVPITVTGVKLSEVQLYNNNSWSYAIKNFLELSEDKWEGITSRENISLSLSHSSNKDGAVVAQECSAIKLKFIQYYNFTEELEIERDVVIPKNPMVIKTSGLPIYDKIVKHVYPFGLYSLTVGYETPVKGIAVYRTHNKEQSEGLVPEKSSYKNVAIIPNSTIIPNSVNIIVSKTNQQTKEITVPGNGIYTYSFITPGTIIDKTTFSIKDVIADDNVITLPTAPYEDKENWWDLTTEDWKYVNSYTEKPTEISITEVPINNTGDFAYNSAEEYWSLAIPNAKTNTTYNLKISVANHEQFDYLLGSFSIISDADSSVTTGTIKSYDLSSDTSDYINYSFIASTSEDITGTLNINIKAVTKESI